MFWCSVRIHDMTFYCGVMQKWTASSLPIKAVFNTVRLVNKVIVCKEVSYHFVSSSSLFKNLMHDVGMFSNDEQSLNVKTSNLGKSPINSGISRRLVQPLRWTIRNRQRLSSSSGSCERLLQFVKSRNDKYSQEPILCGISFNALHFIMFKSSSNLSDPISEGKYFKEMHFRRLSSISFAHLTIDGGRNLSSLHSRRDNLCKFFRPPNDDGSVFNRLHLSSWRSSRDSRLPKVSGRRLRLLLATPGDPPSLNRFKLWSKV